MTETLVIAAVPTRAAIEDVLITRDSLSLSDLPPGAVVGTSAPRRRAQLLNRRPDLEVNDIRGNVETRLGKLEAGDYDAVVMARAGLERVGLLPPSARPLSPEEFLPAPGQGALVIQAREGDDTVLPLASAVNDPISRRCLEIERGLLRGLNAGCSAAVGGWARVSETKVELDAVVLDIDGKQRLFAHGEIVVGEPDRNLVDMVVRELREHGAEELIVRT
jgi:hydroxymethylbilane synthase